MKKGQIIETVNGQHTLNENRFYQSVYCEKDGEINAYQFTDHELEVARNRANRNELDIPLMESEINPWIKLAIAVLVGVLLGAVIW